jgi:hypothetical protein
MNCDFFSDSIPELLDDKFQKKLYKSLGISNIYNLKHNNKNKFLSKIYKLYIKDNILFILFISLLFFFLYYRYKNKKKMKKIKKIKKEHFVRPVFNPYYNVDSQINYNVHPPNKEIAIKHDSQNVGFVGNYNELNIPGQYYPQTFPNYGQTPNCNIPEYSSNGFVNYYDDSKKEELIQNPLGFDTNFNETTNHYVNDNVILNNNTITDQNNLLYKQNNDIINTIDL